MAEVILVVAVNKNGEHSTPFKMYQTKNSALKGQFVLKLTDAGESKNGQPQTKAGNFSLGLIGTNGTDYMESKLKGFRRKHDEDTFIVCEKFSESMSSVKDLAEAEEF